MSVGRFIVRALIEPGRRRAGRFWPSQPDTYDLTAGEFDALTGDKFFSVKAAPAEPAPKADESVDEPPKDAPKDAPRGKGKAAPAEPAPKADESDPKAKG